MKTLVLITAAALVAPVTVVAAMPDAVSAGSCRAATGLLDKAPRSTTALPGGAVMRIWDGGSPRLRVVAVRIPKRGLHPRVLTSGSLTSPTTPSRQTARSPGVIVAVNGGVFIPGKGVPQESLGKAGVAVKAAAKQTNSLAVTTAGDLAFSGNRVTGSVTLRGTKLKVKGLNQQSVVSGGVSVYTGAWGKGRRPSATSGIVVKNGKVTRVDRKAKPARKISKGSVMLLANGAAGRHLAKSKVGQKVTVKHGVAVEYYRAAARPAKGTPWRYLVGNSSRILREGSIPSGLCSGHHEARRQRTAIGLTSTGDVLVVTASGNGSGGASTHQMGEYLRTLGARDAVKLDGGGSTTMLVRKKLGAKLVRVDRAANAPQRAVPNTLVFDATTA